MGVGKEDKKKDVRSRAPRSLNVEKKNKQRLCTGYQRCGHLILVKIFSFKILLFCSKRKVLGMLCHAVLINETIF